MFAILPPEDVAQRIQNERLHFAERYNCVKALKPPVHITIYPPFEEKESFEKEITSMQQWVATQNAFHINVKNYNYFKNRFSPVVYIDVEENKNLQGFGKGFVTRLRKYIHVKTGFGTFKPHFTIGYRDVPPTLLPAIIDYYTERTFTASFNVDSIFLWRHSGKNWETIQEFKLEIGITAGEFQESVTQLPLF